MKATIKTNGLLEVIPENSIEAYALRQWWRHFQNGEDDQSSLCVRVNPEPSVNTDDSLSEENQ